MVLSAADVPRRASGAGSIRIAWRGCNRGASGASGRRILRRVSSGSSDHQRADGRLVLAFVCATAFAVVLNGTMLPVALPEIGEALSLGPVALGLIITGYFLVSAGVAVVALVGFVVRQRTAPVPFVPRALLRNRVYVWLCVATLLVGVIIAVEVAVPLPLAGIGGLGATQIGLVPMPAALITIVWGPASGGIVDRLGVAVPTVLGVASPSCCSRGSASGGRPG